MLPAGRIDRSVPASAVADAGLPAEITPYRLRHTCATRLMEADIETWEAVGYLGITSATLDRC